MTELQRRALAMAPLAEVEVERLYGDDTRDLSAIDIKTLCVSHERLRVRKELAEARLDQFREALSHMADLAAEAISAKQASEEVQDAELLDEYLSRYRRACELLGRKPLA